MPKLKIIEAPGENIAESIREYLHFCHRAVPDDLFISTGASPEEDGEKQELVVLTHRGLKRLQNDRPPSCGILLTPGNVAGPNTDCIVSYGMSGRDTITLSSIGEQECVLAVQREVMTVEGRIIDRQEIPFRRVAGLATDRLLTVTGVLLLLGIEIDGRQQCDSG